MQKCEEELSSQRQLLEHHKQEHSRADTFVDETKKQLLQQQIDSLEKHNLLKALKGQLEQLQQTNSKQAQQLMDRFARETSLEQKVQQLCAENLKEKEVLDMQFQRDLTQAKQEH